MTHDAKLRTALAEIVALLGTARQALPDTASALAVARVALTAPAAIDRPADRAEQLLCELLAVIHRDGGHYQDIHGLEKAVEMAMSLSCCRVADSASLGSLQADINRPADGVDPADIADAHRFMALTKGYGHGPGDNGLRLAGFYYDNNDARRADALPAHAMGAIKRIVERLAALQAGEATPVVERCPYCDGTGDVHQIDGEWLGSCDCVNAAPASPATTVDRAAIVEECARVADQFRCSGFEDPRAAINDTARWISAAIRSLDGWQGYGGEV